MAKDAVATLEETRQKLIRKLLDRKESIDQQLEKLGYKKTRIATCGRPYRPYRIR